MLAPTVLTFTPVPAPWFVALVLGVLVGAPLLGIVHGVRTDSTAGAEYVQAGAIALGFPVVFPLLGVYVAAVLGPAVAAVLFLGALALPGLHLRRCWSHPAVNTAVLAVVYAPVFAGLALVALMGFPL